MLSSRILEFIQTLRFSCLSFFNDYIIIIFLSQIYEKKEQRLLSSEEIIEVERKIWYQIMQTLFI